MKFKHIGKLLILGISSLVIVGCGGGSSSSETPSGDMLTINEQNAHQVYTSFQQTNIEVNNFVSYSLRSLKEIHSPCAPVINGTRTLDNCEDLVQGLLLNGEVSTTISSNGDQVSVDYVNFNLTSLADGTMFYIEKAHIELDSTEGKEYGKATITGELTKNGNTVALNDYTFYGDRNGVTYNGLTKSQDLDKWVSIQAVIPLHDGDTPCPTKGEIFITGQNNSELKATYNSDLTTTLYVNGKFFDDVPSCVN